MNRKQQTQVTYLSCVLDESMSGEPVALKVINKINRKLKFLRNALQCAYLDCACPAWHPNFTEKTKQ